MKSDQLKYLALALEHLGAVDDLVPAALIIVMHLLGLIFAQSSFAVALVDGQFAHLKALHPQHLASLDFAVASNILDGPDAPAHFVVVSALVPFSQHQ